MKLLKKCLCIILVLTVLLSISISSIGNVYAVSASDFISATYASNLVVYTNSAANLMSYPSSNSSYIKATVPDNTWLNAKALHKDTAGKYWYEVQYYNTTLYIDATAATMFEHMTGDITFTDAQSPTNLSLKQGFPIKGKINSTYNELGTITAAMYNGSDLSREPALSSTDNAGGKSYTLDGSTLDYYLYFGTIPAGVYTYAVKAEAISHYIDGNGNLAESVREVLLTSNICSVIDSSNPLPSLHEGIDVSVWNGDINWAKVATQTDFAILRASWETTEDERFDINAQGCRDNGIPFGVYVYSYAETVQEAINEANAVLAIVEPYDLALPIYFDWEDEVCVSLDASTQAQIVKAFCDTVRAAGRQPGLYTYTWLIPNTFTDPYFNTLPIWVAHYGVSYHGYNGGVHMWQYSCTGTIDGISGNVDMNHMYVELPGEDSSDTEYTGKCTYYPSNVTIKTNADTNMREYPASGYDLIETIPTGTSLHATGLYRNTYGNLWYQVERNGQTGYVGADTVTTTAHHFNDISLINPDMASNLSVGQGYYIKGEVSSIYNEISTVHAKVYSAEDIAGTPTLTSNYSPHSKSYSLYKSEVDYGLWFGTQPEGYYTYEVSADVDNYYAEDFTTLGTKTMNVPLWEKPFTVGNYNVTLPDSTQCVHSMTVQPAVEATCTESGLTAGSYCSKCGAVFSVQEEIPAKGHSYKSESCEANCQEGAHTLFTCSECGDTYKEYVYDGTTSDWLETKPEGVDDSQLETKTQYRYSEYEQVKSYEPSMEGYTLFNMEWESQGEKTQECVKSWPEGFDTSNSFYSKYNLTPKTNSTDNYYNKTEVTSETVVGYIYYHWCAGRVIGGGPFNSWTSQTKTDQYSAFHAFYSTEDPSQKTTASDSSVTYPNADCCTDSWWYYNVPVYKQTYTDYKALYTHSRWAPWSEWSDTEYVDDWNTDVETRTVYRVKSAQLGDHKYENGKCIYCGIACEHNFVSGVCANCGKSCDHNWQNEKCTICGQECNHSWKGGVCRACGKVCEHNFVDSSCTICSYICGHEFKDGACLVCGKACQHNFDNGECTICHKACEHSFTDGKCDICGLICTHNFKDGECTICGEACVHGWHNGICTICNTVCSHDFENGKCNICSMQCTHIWDGDTCTVCGSVCEHNYVNGSCDICGTVCKNHNYVEGVCTICSKACVHNWNDGECIICSKVCEHSWEDGTCTVCGLVCEHNWHLGSCTICATQCEHPHWTDGSCDICKTDCDHSFENSTCTQCGKTCDSHNYVDGTCTVCGASEPVYYLCGFINGADYAIGEDAENIGEYKFEDGKLVVTFSENSYVAVKTGDNAKLYMTNGYQGDNFTLAILYNSDTLTNPDKLFVPKGREITFTLIDNSNDTLTLYYQAAPCEHTSHNTDGNCDVCGTEVKHNFKNGSCTVCGLPCDHNFTSGKCTVCGALCGHNFEDGTCTDCGVACEHNFKNGSCTVCGLPCEHSFNDGVCDICGLPCEHSFTDGKCTACGISCEHSFTDGKCENCGVPCKHSFKDGKCEICGEPCEHSFSGSVCDICGAQCSHSFSSGECTQCGRAQFYLVGNINRVETGYNDDFKNLGQYVFENGTLTANIQYDSYVFVKTYDNMNWYMAQSGKGASATLYNTSTADAEDMLFVPGGVTVTFRLTVGENDTLVLSYTVNSCNHLSHDKNANCIACGEKLEHTYIGGVCYVCGANKPQQDMYLFGAINGVDYGCEGDAANIGIYKFVDGKLTVKFSTNSYVGIKTADNADWYMTNGWLGEGVNTAVLYNTNTSINADKLFVPGGVEVTFTLVNNGNDTYTLSYVVNKPEINTKYITLTYENGLKYKVGFSVLNMDDVAMSDMGLAIFSTNDADGTVLTADKLIAGAVSDGASLALSTDAIHPMYMGDTVYFKVYAKLADGSYVYSDIMNYSAVRYVTTVLGNKNASDESKGMVVAMLNYGAEMQKLFGYKTDKLVNAGLSSKQKSYAAAYSDAMVKKSAAVDSVKAAEFAPTGNNDMLYPTVSFNDTMPIMDFNLKTNVDPDGDVRLYLWTAEDYNKVDVLNVGNASGSAAMSKMSDGSYLVSIADFNMAELNETFYVSVVYTADGETCSTGVIAYSMAEFLAANANKNTSPIKALSKAAVVLSYYVNLVAQ